MDSLDPVEESRRLQEHYARLSDDELQAVADEGYDLTELAQQSLQAEIRARGLQFHLRSASTPPAPDPATHDFDPSDFELVVVDRAWDLVEARRLQSILDDAGIPSYLGPDNLERVDAFQGSFDDGVDLKVRYVDNQRALHAISQSSPPDAEVVTDYVPRCPKCHSSEIVFQSLDSTPGSNSAFDSTFNWSCDACGHRWRDDGIEQER